MLNKTKILSLVILFFCLFPFITHASETRGLRVITKDPASGQQAEVPLYNKSYAVIIGIDQYQNLPADRQLSYAVRDAKGVAQALAKNYRFDKIFTLYNKDATKEQIMKLLTVQLPKEIGKNDSLFVFWAGHGNQELTPEGEIGFLIPYDGSADEVYRNVTMTEIRDTISRIIPAKHVFYAMDACYSGLLTTRAVDSKPRRDLAYLKEITKERVRQVLTAGGKDQQVLDGGPSGHSVFTGRLIEILEASGDFITANEIQAILKERVFNDAKGRGYVQTPSFGSLSGNGDFVFVPSVEQKMTDTRTELARLMEEQKRLEALEADAKRKQNEQQLQDAEQARKEVEKRVKAEQLRQQRLAKEQQRIEAEAKEHKRLQSLKLEDEKRLALLKADLEKRRQNLQLSGASTNIESAVAEIKKLHARMQEIESTLERELAPTRQQVLQRYNQKIADLDRQQQSEFETRQEYTDRIQKQKDDLQALRDKELAGLDVRTLAEQQTAPLREKIYKLTQNEYSIPVERLFAQLGRYDMDKQAFPVQVKTIRGQGVQLASAGMVKIPKKEAPDFKKLFEAGLVQIKLLSKVSKDGSPVVVSTVLHEVNNNKSHELPYVDSVTGIEFSFVKGGCFKMGNLKGAPDEQPIHEVCVDDFYMGRTEVTQGQWKTVMGDNPSHFSSCGDNCPVENVSWSDVQNFLKKLNIHTGRNKENKSVKDSVWSIEAGRMYRLPTEAEWEYAARIDNDYQFIGPNFNEIEDLDKEIDSALKQISECGEKNMIVPSNINCNRIDAVKAAMIEKEDDIKKMIKLVLSVAEDTWNRDVFTSPKFKLSWNKKESGDQTRPVGELWPNYFRVFDMVGNVSEWVNDCYSSSSYKESARINPSGAICDDLRVHRGGSWRVPYSRTLRFERFAKIPSYKSNDIGFRIILPLNTTSETDRDPIAKIVETLNVKQIKYNR